jgi:carboxypeptidase C (cathepsin A)
MRALPQVSNLLMFESPPGVGFSYCDECIGNATCRCEMDDLSTASDNADAVIGFFKDKFPELAKNEFYVTGESCKL